MKGYRFYSKFDSLKETINTWPAHNEAEAIKNFAQQKRLSKEEFLRIFEVEEYDRS